MYIPEQINTAADALLCYLDYLLNMQKYICFIDECCLPLYSICEFKKDYRETPNLVTVVLGKKDPKEELSVIQRYHCYLLKISLC